MSSLRPCPLRLFSPQPPPLFARVPINIIPWDLRSLCFHTLTHSFATGKMPSPLFSKVSALFGKNTRGGVGVFLSNTNPTTEGSELVGKDLYPERPSGARDLSSRPMRIAVPRSSAATQGSDLVGRDLTVLR